MPVLQLRDPLFNGDGKNKSIIQKAFRAGKPDSGFWGLGAGFVQGCIEQLCRPPPLVSICCTRMPRPDHFDTGVEPWLYPGTRTRVPGAPNWADLEGPWILELSGCY
eukprot:3196279-Rhodomonas_salina.1